MKIKELKELGYNKLYKRALECANIGWDENDLYDAFEWEGTKEGNIFWGYINDRNFEKALMLFPEYMEKHMENNYAIAIGKDGGYSRQVSVGPNAGWEPKEGEIILVKDVHEEGIDYWRERKFISKFEGKFIVKNITTGKITEWGLAKPIEEPKNETKYLWKVKDNNNGWTLNPYYRTEKEAKIHFEQFKDCKKITSLEELLTITEQH
jgi:hypothetical protein